MGLPSLSGKQEGIYSAGYGRQSYFKSGGSKWTSDQGDIITFPGDKRWKLKNFSAQAFILTLRL